MDNNIERTEKRRRNRVFAGIILLVAGTVYLFNQLNFFFVPNWLFSWPMALILIGIITGAKHNFRNPGWFYMVLVGGVFLVNMIVPSVQVAMLWPLILISIGVRMLFFRESRWCQERWERRNAWRREMHYKADPTSL
jgi:hypothetical protein